MLADYFCKIDNEGYRKIIVKNGKEVPVGLFHASAMGLRAGVSDLFIYYPTNRFHGMWIELKRNMNYPPSARHSDTWQAQVKFQEQVKSKNYHAVTCYGWEHAKKEIEEYLMT